MDVDYGMDELDAEIQGLMRGRTPSDVLIPTKSLYEAKMERRMKADGEPEVCLFNVKYGVLICNGCDYMIYSQFLYRKVCCIESPLYQEYGTTETSQK